MITCEFENGAKTQRTRHAVVDALCIQENTILLTRRAEWMVAGGKWALPGGFIDHDEYIEDALLREVREETGYAAHVKRFIGVIDNPKRRGDDRQNITFLYELSLMNQIAERDEHEVTELKWFPLDDVPDSAEMAFDHLAIIEWWKKNRDTHTFSSPIIIV